MIQTEKTLTGQLPFFTKGGASTKSKEKQEKAKTQTQSAAKTEEGCGSELNLPFGIIGFKEFKKAEIVFSEEELPFLRLREPGEEGLEFLVMEPYGMIPNYTLEIGDEDLRDLNIESQKDVHLLNIVTVHGDQRSRVTVNLIAPIVINKKTLQAKQVIVSNFHKYTAKYLLHENESTE